MTTRKPEADMQRPLPEGRLLRLNDWTESAGLVFAGLVVFLGLIVLFTPSISAHSATTRVIAGLVWVGVGLMIAGGVRSGVIVTEEGIKVRGILRSQTVKWSEIESFEIKAPILRGALRIRLIDGTALSAMGFDGNSAKERALAKAWLHELNQRAATARSSN
jgi:hypothetical protein